MTPPVLDMRGIRKTFPGVVALDDVSLTLQAGDVHMLLGENGAGKSTLMKILSGACRKDAGEIAINGRPVEIGSPRDALALGIRVIYQELDLVPQLSVAENIFLGATPTRWAGVVDWRALHERTSQLLRDLGMAIDPRTPVVTPRPLAAADGRDRQGAGVGRRDDPRHGRADVLVDEP